MWHFNNFPLGSWYKDNLLKQNKTFYKIYNEKQVLRQTFYRLLDGNCKAT